MSEPVWFTRRVTFLWPVAWQGWALVLVPAAVAGLLMVVIAFRGAAADALVEIGFLASVMAVAFVVYAIAVGKSAPHSRHEREHK